MTGFSHKPLKIYVEDILSETIIKHLTISMNMIGKVNIKCFGSIENAFTLAAGLILKNEPLENTLIVPDGDRYTLPEYNLYQMINELATDNNTCEIIKCAKHIRAVNDSHN